MLLSGLKFRRTGRPLVCRIAAKGLHQGSRVEEFLRYLGDDTAADACATTFAGEFADPRIPIFLGEGVVDVIGALFVLLDEPNLIFGDADIHEQRRAECVLHPASELRHRQKVKGPPEARSLRRT